MKAGIISISQVMRANRMDAGFHLAKKAHEETEKRLRETITPQQAGDLVQQIIDNGPATMAEKLTPYARGNDPRRRLAEIVRDHPYEAAAMIVDNRAEIEKHLAEEAAQVARKTQAFDKQFADILGKGDTQ